MDKETAQSLHEDLSALLEKFCEMHGMTVTESMGSYYSADGTFKITRFAMAETKTNEHGEEEPAGFREQARRWKIPEDCYNRPFQAPDGEIYAVVGLLPRSRKYKLKARRVRDGEIRLLPLSFIRKTSVC